MTIWWRQNNIGILDCRRSDLGWPYHGPRVYCLLHSTLWNFVLTIFIRNPLSFKNLNNTLHTQSTYVIHLQCHIVVPPSFNQWDKIDTLQTSFFTNSRMVILNSSSYSSGTLLWSYKLQVWLLNLELLYLNYITRFIWFQSNWTICMPNFNIWMFLCSV